jgi:hypothetical protein
MRVSGGITNTPTMKKSFRAKRLKAVYQVAKWHFKDGLNYTMPRYTFFQLTGLKSVPIAYAH